jgi:hypothetical protein
MCWKITLPALLSVAAMIGLLNSTSAPAQVNSLPDFIGLADAEGDGIVGEDEFTAYYALLWDILAAGEPKVIVAQANPILRAAILGVLPDPSPTLRRDELLDAASAHYRDADTDGNGVVTMTEMRVWQVTAMTPRAA